MFVEGKLQTRSWEQDGQVKYMTEVVASDMLMLGGKPGAQQGSGHSQFGNSETGGEGDMDDDIPF